MISIMLTGARCAMVGVCLVIGAPVGAVSFVATSATLNATLATMAAGDTVALVGTFGELRLQNRTFTRAITIDARQAVFTTTMVFDNVRGVSLSGGTFNIANNGAYAKGIAVYGGSNIYIDGVTVNGGGDGAVDQYGIAINGAYNAQVTNAKLNGLYSGIGMGQTTAGLIARNKITGATADGIDIADSHSVLASANSCTGGRPGPGAHPDCIQMWSIAGHALESDITVTNNAAYGPTQGFTDFDAGLRINISHNVVNTSYSQGIACYSCIDSTVSYNTMSTLPGSTYQTRYNVVGGSNNTVVGNIVAAYNEPRPASATASDEALDGFTVPVFGGDYLASSGGAAFAGEAAAVPEPSSWVLLVAGFAAVGVARRRAVATGRIA